MPFEQDLTQGADEPMNGVDFSHCVSGKALLWKRFDLSTQKEKLLQEALIGE